MSNKKVYAVVAIGVLMASLSAIIIKELIANGVSPDVAAFYRMLTTVLLLAPFALLNTNHRQAIGALSRREKGIAVLSGVFLALHFLCWFFSLKYTSVFYSTVLVNLMPVFLLVVESIWYHHRPSGKEISGVVLALGGLVIMSMPGSHEAAMVTRGNLLAILAAVFMGGYFLCSRSIRPKLHIVPYSFIVYGVCALGIFLWVVLAGRPLAGYTAKDFLLFLASAVLCTLLGHSLFQWSLRYIRASTLSVCLLGQPVASSVFAFLMYREILGPFAYVGGAILLVGIALFNLKGKKKAAA